MGVGRGRLLMVFLPGMRESSRCLFLSREGFGMFMYVLYVCMHG